MDGVIVTSGFVPHGMRMVITICKCPMTLILAKAFDLADITRGYFT